MMAGLGQCASILTAGQQLPQAFVHDGRAQLDTAGQLVRTPAQSRIALQLLVVAVLRTVQRDVEAALLLQLIAASAAGWQERVASRCQTFRYRIHCRWCVLTASHPLGVAVPVPAEDPFAVLAVAEAATGQPISPALLGRVRPVQVALRDPADQILIQMHRVQTGG